MAQEDALSEEQYFAQYGADIGFAHPIDSGKKPYEFNINSAQTGLQSGDVMGELVKFLVALDGEYAGGRPHLLYYPVKPTDLVVHAKSYESVLTKVYRYNYLYNRRFPQEPKHGFIKFDNIYNHYKINDLLRSRLICKYIDGPKFVSEKIKTFCESRGLNFRFYAMHNDRGYHAWHSYIRVPVELMIDGVVESREISFEIQITTQLAESIAELTHGLYEGQRVSAPGVPGEEWRWEPRSQEFRSAYLGHTLHLLEGVICTFRDEVLGLQAGSPEIPEAAADVVDILGDAGGGRPDATSDSVESSNTVTK